MRPWHAGAAILASASLMLAAIAGMPADAAGETALVKTEPLAKHKIAQTLTVYGRVRADPDNESSIALTHDGLIDRVYVRLGERLTAGMPLVEVETAPASRMAYQQAEAAADYARSELARLERLLSERLATTDQVAAARQTLSQAEAKLESEKKLGSGQTREVLRAPFDGIVTKLVLTQGDRATANTTALIMAQGGALIVPLGVEPEDAVRLSTGMPVTLISVFEPSLTIKAHVDQIHAMVDPTTRLVDAIVRVTEPDASRLMLGLLVKGVITLSETDALAVPAKAVLRDDQGTYVFVTRDGRARRIAVETGTEQAGLVEVTGALSVRDPVVVEGNYELSDGMAVREQRP